MKSTNLNNITIGELKEIKNKTISDYYKQIPIIFSLSISPLLVPNTEFTIIVESLAFYLTLKSVKKKIDITKNFNLYCLNSKEYQDTYKSYLLLLKELLNLFKNLDFNNEMEIFCAYTYLFKRGYLSENHEFHYYHTSEYCIDFLGLNVILGLGDCKHINSMLTDLLNLSNNNSYNIMMSLNNRNNNSNKMSSSNENKTLSQKPNVHKFNHIATLTTNSEISYIMDACNNTIFNIYNNKAYQNGKTFCIEYFDSLNKNKKSKLSEIYCNTQGQKLNKRISDYYKTLAFCENYHDIFETFYQEHKELYNEINFKAKVLIKEYQKI